MHHFLRGKCSFYAPYAKGANMKVIRRSHTDMGRSELARVGPSRGYLQGRTLVPRCDIFSFISIHILKHLRRPEFRHIFLRSPSYATVGRATVVGYQPIAIMLSANAGSARRISIVVALEYMLPSVRHGSLIFGRVHTGSVGVFIFIGELL